MKKTLLSFLLHAAVCTTFAQKAAPPNFRNGNPVDVTMDKQEYQGYTIRLLPVMPGQGTGSYGFDILKDNKPVVYQLKNPLSFSPKGIQTKQDAYLIAQWMINEYAKTNHWQTTGCWRKYTCVITEPPNVSM